VSARARHLASLLARWLVLLGVQALVLAGLSNVLGGVHQISFGEALLVVLAISLVNAFIWPAVIRLALPLTLITFGLASLAMSAGVVALAFLWATGDAPAFGTDLAIAAVLALLSTTLVSLLDFDGDARNLRVVRRRARHARAENRTDVPGVIMFEIDGLGEEVLRGAVEDGHAPTIARWLEAGTHKVLGWECDLSSQTGASQAGLLLGSNWDMPAFRWYEKESGRTIVSNHPRDAAELERRRSTGRGLLAEGGTSRGNMFSGDAPRCTITMSAVSDRSRSRASDLFAYFADPYGLLRTIWLSLADVSRERWAARRQRRDGAPRIERSWVYALIRASITVVMRDLNVAMLAADIVEGVPVSYATFVGYDEVAHHSGIRAPDALTVLRQHDRQLARLERAAEQAPRPYHLVVLSDHGQTQGAPFRQRYGQTLDEVVQHALEGGDVRAPAAVDEAWGDVGAALADARQEPSVGGRALAMATRSRAVDGTVALGPAREAISESGAHENGSEAVVLVSGCLGLVYLTASKQRLTLEEIAALHPRLIETLAAHAGISFVMVRSREHGALVIGARGRRHLDDDTVEGEDPLAGFGETAGDHLRRHDSFPHCPDILVNGLYDPEAREIAPFEEFMGSHGGLGGPQMKPFAVLPSEWADPGEPIVGVEAMHAALMRWLAAEKTPPDAGGDGRRAESGRAPEPG
jgi:uncharacterized membrane protein YvlD (DUF360 family)